MDFLIGRKINVRKGNVFVDPEGKQVTLESDAILVVRRKIAPFLYYAEDEKGATLVLGPGDFSETLPKSGDLGPIDPSLQNLFPQLQDAVKYRCRDCTSIFTVDPNWFKLQPYHSLECPNCHSVNIDMVLKAAESYQVAEQNVRDTMDIAIKGITDHVGKWSKEALEVNPYIAAVAVHDVDWKGVAEKEKIPLRGLLSAVNTILLDSIRTAALNLRKLQQKITAEDQKLNLLGLNLMYEQSSPSDSRTALADKIEGALKLESQEVSPSVEDIQVTFIKEPEPGQLNFSVEIHYKSAAVGEEVVLPEKDVLKDWVTKLVSEVTVMEVLKVEIVEKEGSHQIKLAVGPLSSNMYGPANVRSVAQI